VARRTNISPYEADSDSDTEEFRTRRRHKGANILKSGRELLGRLGSSRDFDEEEYASAEDEFPYPANTLSALTRDDDSEASDECMILTDDEDDASETDTPPKRTRDDYSDIYGVASPRSSQTPSNLGAIQSMFAEKHPWRRQSRRDSTKVYSSLGPRLPTVNSMEDEVEGPQSVRSSFRDRISGLSILQSRSEEEEEAQDESSSSSEGEASSTQSSVSIISDPEEELDFSTLESIPNYFTSHPQVMLAYLDPSAHNHDSHVFAYEHSLLVRAVLQLLAERDYIGVEADIDDPTCIVKKGPLKKATHAVGRTTWRVKYVEIRPGSFSYFEDNGKRDNFGRKTISLRSNRCICESVGVGNLFALEMEGGPRRLWMTNSDDECQAWVRAIQNAMIGGGVGESNHVLDVSQYQAALDQFEGIQMTLFGAETRDEYISCVEELLQTNIRIPAQWVRDRVNMNNGTQSTTASSASAQKRSSVTGFWKSLKQDNFSINGCVVSGSSPHAAERIIGALSRCILELDKSSPVEGHVQMSELQALSFARDVMMTVLRSRSMDKSRMTLEYLCQNPSLAVAIERLETAEPLSLQVNYATPEASQNPERDISGWIGTRTRFKGMWRNRFLVISDGILNVFEHSSPRPHGLRGQLLLSGADVSVVEDKPKNESHLHILRIASKNKESERQLVFPDEELLKEWKDAVEKAMESFSSAPEDGASILVTPKSSMIPAAGGRIIQGASESGVKIIKGATDQLVKATDMIRASMRSSTKGTHSRTSSTEVRGGSKHGGAETSDSFGLTSSFESEITRQEPTVQIAAVSTSMYRIMGSVGDSPGGCDGKDAWV